jgi:hypothetical protein
VRRTARQLENAGNLAPHAPGWLVSLGHDVEAGWDSAVGTLSIFVHDKALLEFISGVCNIVATVAGLLALFPPLSLIFGPIALIAAGLALVSDSLLAIFDKGGIVAVGEDFAAVALGFGWMKAAGKLSGMFRDAGLAKMMTKAPTWKGLVSVIPRIGDGIDEADKTVPVAPGLFRMIGNSLKEAAGGTNVAVKEMNAIKDFEGYNTWRALDVFCGTGAWTLTGMSIEAVPGEVRNWVNRGPLGQPGQ